MPNSGAGVSVVIPTYNRARLVGRCIESLMAGGVPALEVIVVDDGGDDDTESVVAGRALYLRQANAGPAAARNYGFSFSAGRYVGFIDSDDEWVRRHPGRLLAQLEANPEVDVVFADSLMGNPEAGFSSFVATYGGEDFSRLPGQDRAAGLRVLDRKPLFRQLSTRNVMFLGSMLIRREFFERVGGFDPALRGAADWDFFMRATAAGTVGYSPGPATSFYYKHAEGMSTDSDHMEEDFIRALDAVRRRAPLDPDDRAHVNGRLRAHVFGWAWRAYERRDLVTARRRLEWGRSLGEFGLREAMYLTATYLPMPLVDAFRRSRRLISAGG